MTKFPLSGALTCSNAGGQFPTEMKKAGFDGIIFRGKAEKPVYFWIEDGKSRNSDILERQIPITRPLKEVIERIPNKGKYVFINPRTGTKYDYRKGMLKGLCKRAEVKYFTFHALRHYGASTLAQKGVPLTDIQTLLGHQRATTTDLYMRRLGVASVLNLLNNY